MANRMLWNVPCGAHRTDGQPCRAWSMRGSFTCRCHGSATKAAREWAQFRLAMTKFHRGVLADMLKMWAELDAMTPEQRVAHGEAVLAAVEATLPPPKPRHPPLVDDDGVSWALTPR